MPSATRPASVTVIWWILITTGVLGLYGDFNAYRMTANGEFDRKLKFDPGFAEMMKDVPRATMTQLTIATFVTALYVAAGMMLLNGNGKGRYLYLAVTVAAMLYAVAIGTPIRFLLPPAVITAGLLFFLFRPTALRYFAEASTQTPTPTEGGNLGSP